jgi:hypothetical protein
VGDTFPTSATLDGFNISSAQYPPQGWRPKNVNLYEQDSFKPFPQEFLGQYDVVNLRSALCYINNEDAEPLLENWVSLLSECHVSVNFGQLFLIYWMVFTDGR